MELCEIELQANWTELSELASMKMLLESLSLHPDKVLCHKYISGCGPPHRSVLHAYTLYIGVISRPQNFICKPYHYSPSYTCDLKYVPMSYLQMPCATKD